MAPHERAQMNPVRKTIISTGLIFMGIGGLVLLTLLGLDARCGSDIDFWMPMYPDGDVVSVEHTYFRARGLGTTRMVVATDDDEATVGRWYRDYNREVGRGRANRGLANTDYRVQENPEGDGSLIMMVSQCAFR